MGNSSSADKLTDAEATAVKHFNNKDFASLMKLLEQEPVDLFKLISFNKNNPEDIKNGLDFIHTLLSLDNQVFESTISAVSILKAFKQTIESNKQKNTAASGSPDEKPYRETPQFDKFPYSYLQFVIFNNPEDLESFIFLLDNKETFPSPPPASQSLVHDLCSNPRAIELLRLLISSGEFPERFKNSSSTNNLDEQMRGSANSVVLEHHRSFTPLQAACAAANKLAVQELCVAGLGGSNYGECAETLLTSAITGEQHHNLGSVVLFGKETPAQPQEVSVDDVSDTLLCLLAQPNAGSAIRKHRVQLSSIQSKKARDGVVAVFKSRFNISSLDTVNLMHLAFAFCDGLKKSANNDKNNSSASADTFLKTALENKLAVCTPEELTLTSSILLSASMRLRELESALKLIEQYRLREWLITSEQELDLSSCGETVDDDTLRRVSSALPSLQSLNLRKCDNITDDGLEHLAKLSSLQALDLYFCDNITDSGLQHLATMSSLQSLNLSRCGKITDNGLQHLEKLSSLQSLNLGYCRKITDSGIQQLAKLSSLQTLDLAHCDKITDNGLQHLAKLSALQTLNLEWCKLITDDGLQHLAKLSSLQALHLHRCDEITDSGLQHLVQLSSLQSLDLAYCKLVTDGGLQHLAKISSLQSLNLERCRLITDSGLQHLAKLLSIQSLDLYQCDKITDSGVQHLASLSVLQSLTLSDCSNITNDAIQFLVKLSSLQSLRLASCKLITDSGLEHLVKGLVALKALSIGSCKLITDNGIQHLANLPSLTSLDLHYLNITDSGLQHLAKLSSLQSLDLYSCNRITDSGLQHLAKLSSLQTLNLSGCTDIMDSGLEHLAKLSSLRTLHLNKCDKITDSGIKNLAKLPALENLSLYECKKITDSGLQHLRTVLPSMHIHCR